MPIMYYRRVYGLKNKLMFSDPKQYNCVSTHGLWCHVQLPPKQWRSEGRTAPGGNQEGATIIGVLTH